MTTATAKKFDDMSYQEMKALKAQMEVLLTKMEKADTREELTSLVSQCRQDFPVWFYFTVERKCIEVEQHNNHFWHYRDLIRHSTSLAHLFDVGMKIKFVSDRMTEQQIIKLRTAYIERRQDLM